MKKTTIYLIICLLIYGCESETQIGLLKQPFKEEAQKGYLSAIGITRNPKNDPNGKIDVPECDANEPVEIRYVLIDSIGNERTESSPVTMQNNGFTLDAPIEIETGVYQVTEVALYDYEGKVAYSVPDESDARFPFAVYVGNPTPYEIEILPNESRTDNIEAFCYTYEPQIFYGEYGYDGTTVQLTTLYLYIFNLSCISKIELQVNDREPIDLVVLPDNAYGVPIPRFSTFSLRAYVGDEIVQEYLEQGEYDQEGNLYPENSYYFYYECD